MLMNNNEIAKHPNRGTKNTVSIYQYYQDCLWRDLGFDIFSSPGFIENYICSLAGASTLGLCHNSQYDCTINGKRFEIKFSQICDSRRRNTENKKEFVWSNVVGAKDGMYDYLILCGYNQYILQQGDFIPYLKRISIWMIPYNNVKENATIKSKIRIQVYPIIYRTRRWLDRFYVGDDSDFADIITKYDRGMKLEELIGTSEIEFSQTRPKNLVTLRPRMTKEITNCFNFTIVKFIDII